MGQHVLQLPDITIFRGTPNESDDPPPATCTFTLNDSADKGNGDYNPYSPVGQWYGQLTRNVPVRVGLEVGQDAFARTSASNWGTSPDNGVWSPRSTGNSVSGGEGRQSISLANTYDFSYLSTVDARDVDVSVSVTIDSISNIAGGALEPANILLRGQDLTHYYICRMAISASEVVTVEIRDVDFELLAGPVTLGTAYTGQQWRVRAQAEGRSLRFKAWPAAGAEPLDWDVIASDRTFYPSGWVGVRSGVALGNSNTKPIVFRYDNFELRLPRFEGETTRLVPDADSTMTLRTTSVRCSDITQRLSQGKSPVTSPMRRSIAANAVSNGVFAYYPAEDGRFTTSIAPGLSHEPMQVLYGVLSAKFGESEIFPGSLPLPEIGTTEFRATMPAHTVTGNYQWRSVMLIPGGQDDTAIFAYQLTTTGSASKWHVQLEQDGSLSVRAFSGGLAGGIILDDFGNAVTTDIPMYLQLSLSQNGANIDYELRYMTLGEGATAHIITSGTVNSQTLGAATLLDIIGGVPDSGFPGPNGAVVGHFSIGNSIAQLTAANVYFNSYDGETVYDRMTRLSEENGLPAFGDLYDDAEADDTMGPQRPDTLLNNVRECARTNHGILFSPKGDRTMAYRRLESLYDPEPLASLDHADGIFQPGFRPVNDDFNPRNDVTVQRRDGGSAQAVREDGPNNALDPGTADGAVGTYATTYQVNCETDDQAAYSAGWLLHLGTTDEPRFPEIPLELSSIELRDDPATQSALLDCGPGDALELVNLTKWGIYEPAVEMILGYTERFNTTYRHLITFNAVPAKPYTIGSLDDGSIRLDSGSSTLNEDLTDTETGVDVATSDPNDLWITTASNPGDFPFDVTMTGERVTVTAITGSSSPQTFTVTRSVNGVVKEHFAGEKVSLSDPYYVAR
ncbi:MAG TPA: hypothetical protein VGP26_24530 [Actinophytocola sp.]|nr:hypothetical protein [Actinophytocola sp.]